MSAVFHSNHETGGVSCQFNLLSLFLKVDRDGINFVVSGSFLSSFEVREVNQLRKFAIGAILLGLSNLPLHHYFVVEVKTHIGVCFPRGCFRSNWGLIDRIEKHTAMLSNL